MKKLTFIFALLFIAKFTFAQDITQGTWYNAEKTSKIQFYKQENKLFGKIVWLKEPLENGKPKVDKLNSDSKLKTRPIMGLVFLTNFTADGAKVWEDGEIYDPNNGKTYSCKLTITSPTTIDARGYIGISIIGRTTKFTKAD
ncbi:DUF2147 domain-containing protein [Emticicia sp.]|uniref:DUF2147 domain-containing protein n=1 Tax=Emticicia sp. TaxID=1930953 RepID=UPI003752BA72